MENCNHKKRKSEYCDTCHQIQRYKHNKLYRERKRKNAIDWFRRKNVSDPDWNSKKQREYRKNNPAKFNFIMAKHYWKKLTPKQRKALNTSK